MSAVCCKQRYSNDKDNDDAHRQTIPFPKDGIRLSSLHVFYNACGGRDKLLV